MFEKGASGSERSHWYHSVKSEIACEWRKPLMKNTFISYQRVQTIECSSKSWYSREVVHPPSLFFWAKKSGSDASTYRSPQEPKEQREIKFIGLFEDRGHRGPYSPYKTFNHNLYIGTIIFPHIDNPQSTGYNSPKKKPIKIINEKSEGPINLTNHWRKRLWISLHVDLKRLN